MSVGLFKDWDPTGPDANLAGVFLIVMWEGAGDQK